MDDENPFADPNQVNPFMDPSVTQVSGQSTTVGAGLEDSFNPFQGQGEPATVAVSAPIISANDPAPYAAPYNPAPSYGSGGQAPRQPPRQYGNDEQVLKQDTVTIAVPLDSPPPEEKLVEDEFRKREEDLERRERQLRDEQKRLEDARVYGDRVPNFPPLPAFCPIKPCVYHNIDFEIPPEHQVSVRRVFYHWQFTVFCLLFNFVATFALICVKGTDQGSAFGMGLLYAALFIPLSFITWYRMLYNAVRLDSSLRYMLFFFVYGFQILFAGIAALGFKNSGYAGWITAFSVMSDSKGLGVFCILVSMCWCANCLVAVYLILQIHKTYRTTGQSMEKASGEFAASAGSSRNVGQAVLRSL